MWPTCLLRSSALTGTKTPPARLIPKIAAHSSSDLSRKMATRSRRFSPCALRTAAQVSEAARKPR
jgi:hypothetical protein